MPNNYKLCTTYFSRGGENFVWGGFTSPGYGPGGKAVPTPNIKED